MLLLSEAEARERLVDMTDASLTVKPGGISLDLRNDPAGWDAVMRALGRKEACRLLAERVRANYLAQTGKSFPFTEPCVAYEIGYHINAYLWSIGYRGHPRHITTRFFTRKALQRHCSTVEIDEESVRDFRQRVVFHYRKGYYRTEQK